MTGREALAQVREIVQVEAHYYLDRETEAAFLAALDGCVLLTREEAERVYQDLCSREDLFHPFTESRALLTHEESS